MTYIVSGTANSSKTLSTWTFLSLFYTSFSRSLLCHFKAAMCTMAMQSNTCAAWSCIAKDIGKLAAVPHTIIQGKTSSSPRVRDGSLRFSCLWSSWTCLRHHSSLGQVTAMCFEPNQATGECVEWKTNHILVWQYQASCGNMIVTTKLLYLFTWTTESVF